MINPAGKMHYRINITSLCSIDADNAATRRMCCKLVSWPMYADLLFCLRSTKFFCSAGGKFATCGYMPANTFIVGEHQFTWIWQRAAVAKQTSASNAMNGVKIREIFVWNNPPVF